MDANVEREDLLVSKGRFRRCIREGIPPSLYLSTDTILHGMGQLLIYKTENKPYFSL